MLAMAALAVCLTVILGFGVPATAFDIGPYTVVMENVQKCSTSSVVQGHYELTKVNGQRILQGRMMHLQDFSHLTGRLTTSTKRNGGWKKDGLSHNIPDLCHMTIVKDIMAATDIIFTDNCTINKGNYTLKNLDLNGPIHRLLGNVMERGYVRNEFAIISQGKQISCVVVDTRYKAAN